MFRATSPVLSMMKVWMIGDRLRATVVTSDEINVGPSPMFGRKDEKFWSMRSQREDEPWSHALHGVEAGVVNCR